MPTWYKLNYRLTLRILEIIGQLKSLRLEKFTFENRVRFVVYGDSKREASQDDEGVECYLGASGRRTFQLIWRV